MFFKNAELHNVAELIRSEENDGFLMSRVPDTVRLKLNDFAKNETAFNGTGCEIRFNLEGETAKIKLRRIPSEYYKFGTGLVEIYFGSFQGDYTISPQFIRLDTVEILVTRPGNMDYLIKKTKEYNLPFDPNLVRVILPYDWSACLIDIEGEISLPGPGQAPVKKYLAYGSSITHGSTAVRPTGTYAMRIAQILGSDLINLGFQGSALLEKEMADYIADKNDWDFATLELGANLFGLGSELTSEVKIKVDYFITRIAERNPGKWVFCIDLLTSGLEDDAETMKFRNLVSYKVNSLQLPKLKYISGRDILKSITSLTTDICHPSATGEEEIAINLSRMFNLYLSS